MSHPILALIAAVAAGAIYLWANWDTLGPKFAALIERITGYFGNLKDQALDVGRQMINGIIDGVTSRLDALKSTITGIGDSSVGWLKEKLGIHSPSRVFAELGGFTMEGFKEGMEGGENGPLDAVAALSKKLAAIGAGVAIGGSAMAGGIALDNRPPLAPAAMLAGGGGDTYHITIQAAPSADAQDLAAEIERVLERIEARKAARRRSQLSDME